MLTEWAGAGCLPTVHGCLQIACHKQLSGQKFSPVPIGWGIVPRRIAYAVERWRRMLLPVLPAPILLASLCCSAVGNDESQDAEGVGGSRGKRRFCHGPSVARTNFEVGQSSERRSKFRSFILLHFPGFCLSMFLTHKESHRIGRSWQWEQYPRAFDLYQEHPVV